MKNIWLSVVLMGLWAKTAIAQTQYVNLCFDETCEIVINGASNVSPFSCGMAQVPVHNGAIPVNTHYTNGKLHMNNVEIKLPTSSFMCDNKAMTRDFQKSLKADAHPFVTLYFNHLVLPTSLELKSSQRNVPALIYFKIAGVKKSFKVVFSKVDLREDILIINGSINMAMSDFGIKPPSALFGMIQAEDKIRVDFILRFCVS